MPESLDNLKSFEDCLRQYCAPVYQNMQNGLSRGYVEKNLALKGIHENKLNELYQWRNGINREIVNLVGEFNFSSKGRMLPLEEALEHREIFINDGLWKDLYFPLLTSGGGDYLLLDTDENSKTYGMLLFYAPALLIVEPETAYDNIDAFLKTTISCFKEDVYKFDNTTTTLEINDDREFELAGLENPRSAYWKI